MESSAGCLVVTAMQQTGLIDIGETMQRVPVVAIKGKSQAFCKDETSLGGGGSSEPIFHCSSAELTIIITIYYRVHSLLSSQLFFV